MEAILSINELEVSIILTIEQFYRKKKNVLGGHQK